jgi:3-oxoacyl-[acyl-carrier-protein] synthase-3
MEIYGIEDIAVYLPERRISNLDMMSNFSVDENFLTEKIGVLYRSIKAANETTSDMCLKVLEKLIQQRGLDRDQIQALVIVTQNPDSRIPHISGLVHHRAKLPTKCATFDISLGCSGYVYGLSILQSFLNQNGLEKGVLITCDPYSEVIDPEDKNTALLFGDAATATLMGLKPMFVCSRFIFGTQGDHTRVLACKNNKFQMNGREVFNFVMKTIPMHVLELLNIEKLGKEDIDAYIFHQGSRFIVEALGKKLALKKSKVRIGMVNTGNTVSSSIPILLEEEITRKESITVLLSGFGVGLSWASCICRRIGE